MENTRASIPKTQRTLTADQRNKVKNFNILEQNRQRLRKNIPQKGCPGDEYGTQEGRNEDQMDSGVEYVQDGIIVDLKRDRSEVIQNNYQSSKSLKKIKIKGKLNPNGSTSILDNQVRKNVSNLESNSDYLVKTDGVRSRGYNQRDKRAASALATKLMNLGKKNSARVETRPERTGFQAQTAEGQLQTQSSVEFKTQMSNDMHFAILAAGVDNAYGQQKSGT